jgi:hypothetical protein
MSKVVFGWSPSPCPQPLSHPLIPLRQSEMSRTTWARYVSSHPSYRPQSSPRSLHRISSLTCSSLLVRSSAFGASDHCMNPLPRAVSHVHPLGSCLTARRENPKATVSASSRVHLMFLSHRANQVVHYLTPPRLINCLLKTMTLQCLQFEI